MSKRYRIAILSRLHGAETTQLHCNSSVLRIFCRIEMRILLEAAPHGGRLFIEGDLSGAMGHGLCKPSAEFLQLSRHQFRLLAVAVVFVEEYAGERVRDQTRIAHLHNMKIEKGCKHIQGVFVL